MSYVQMSVVPYWQMGMLGKSSDCQTWYLCRYQTCGVVVGVVGFGGVT